MAESTLSILLQLKDEATTQLKEFQKSIENTKKALDTLQSAAKIMIGIGGALTAGFGLSAKAAFEEQANIGRLSIMLKNVGVNYDDVRDSLERVITTTQYKTGVADSMQRDVLSRLVMVTNDYNKALGLLPLTLDLAAAGGMDATTAATYLGKALEELNNGAEKVTIRLGQASMQFSSLAELEERVKGAAESMANPLDILKASIGDLAEGIGGALIPVIKSMIDGITPVIRAFQQFVESNPNVVKAIAALGVAILGAGGLLFAFVQVQKAIIAVRSALIVLQGITFGQAAATKALTTATAAQTTANTALGGSFLGLRAGILGVTGAMAGLTAGLAMIGFGITKLMDLNTKYNDYLATNIEYGKELQKYQQGEANDLANVAERYADAYEAYVKASGMRKSEKEERLKYIETLRGTIEQLKLEKEAVEANTAAYNKYVQEITAAYGEAQKLIDTWYYQHSAAGQLGIDMNDVYNYLLDIGVAAQSVADAYVKYGTDTKNLNQILKDFGLNLDDLGMKYGNLKATATDTYNSMVKASEEAMSKMVSDAQTAADHINGLIDAINKSLMQPEEGTALGGGESWDLQRVLSYYPQEIIDRYKEMFGDEWERMITTYGTGTGEIITPEEVQRLRGEGNVPKAVRPLNTPMSPEDVGLLGLPLFQSGGVVPGPVGQPVPIIAHGGEQFLGTSKSTGDIYNITVLGSTWGNKELSEEIRKQVLLTKNRNYNAGLS